MQFSSNEAREFFCSLSLTELRHRQDLCEQQQVMAHRQRNVAASEALSVMESDLTLAVGVVAGLWRVG